MRALSHTLPAVFALALLAAPPPLRADGPEDFEMATYQVAFLMKGPAWSPRETPERAKLQEAHMADCLSGARRADGSGERLSAQGSRGADEPAN